MLHRVFRSALSAAVPDLCVAVRIHSHTRVILLVDDTHSIGCTYIQCRVRSSLSKDYGVVILWLFCGNPVRILAGFCLLGPEYA